MQEDPGIVARLLEFAAALLLHWWAIMAGGIFAVEPMIEGLCGDRWKEWIDQRWARDKRRKHFRIAAAAAFVVASFLAFDDVARDNLRLRRQLTSRPVDQSVRSLSDDQKQRMRPVLRLEVAEHYTFQINSVPNCDECELFAQDLRDFIGSVPGWSVDGGAISFGGSPWRYGMWLVARADERQTVPIKKLDHAFKDAGLVLRPYDENQAPRGSFVIIVARQEK